MTLPFQRKYGLIYISHRKILADKLKSWAIHGSDEGNRADGISYKINSGADKWISGISSAENGYIIIARDNVQIVGIFAVVEVGGYQLAVNVNVYRFQHGIYVIETCLGYGRNGGVAEDRC